MSDASRSNSAITRRAVLAAATSALLVPLRPGTAGATPEQLTAAIKQVVGGSAAKPGRVRLEIPELAENGNSVPLTVTVDSPMTAADHVRAIHILSEQNPSTNVVSFQLSPRAGRAKVSTSIRLATSQRVTAIAELSDSSYWRGDAMVVVTIAACVDGD